jgi:hypothetical protein
MSFPTIIDYTEKEDSILAELAFLLHYKVRHGLPSIQLSL